MPSMPNSALPTSATSTDAQIVAAIASGMSQREIARTLHASRHRIRRLAGETFEQIADVAPAVDDGINHPAIALIEDLLPPAAQLDAILLDAEMPAPRAQALAIQEEVIRAPIEPAGPSPLLPRIHAPQPRRLDGRRFLLTSAQEGTPVHPEFLASLLVMADEVDAELLVSGYTYNRAAVGDASQGRLGEKGAGASFASDVMPYLCNESVRLADDLVFCAELDILPTAVDPLSGLDSYTGSSSAVVPHAKVAMRSMPRMKGRDPRFLFTTGTVTQRHYVQRKAGQKAEHHHVYGALFIEMDPDGTWFPRQIIADDSGCFHDLERRYTPTGSRPMDILAWQPGDIHREKADQDTLDAIWGRGGLVDQLRPRHQIIHDVADFTARNHHNLKDPHWMARQLAAGAHADTVEEDIKQVAGFLASASRSWCRTHVIPSNHDEAFERWLREADGHRDARNAYYWHEWNAVVFRAIRERRDVFIFEAAVRAAAGDAPLQKVAFLRRDESLEIGGIEHALHGDLGPNGSRGSPKAFRSMGTRVSTGHTHSASIYDGVYTPGTVGRMDMGYNKGPSSWSQSGVVTYPNGKRSIIILRGTRWRAGQGGDQAVMSAADIEDIIFRA
ncbi:MAG: hypothetical protein DI601_00300 [Azospirillum brasilense]|nr:MAG: hypothetical protein DI601_00300 [Azospirillum brasilense]